MRGMMSMPQISKQIKKQLYRTPELSKQPLIIKNCPDSMQVFKTVKLRTVFFLFLDSFVPTGILKRHSGD